MDKERAMLAGSLARAAALTDGFVCRAPRPSCLVSPLCLRPWSLGIPKFVPSELTLTSEFLPQSPEHGLTASFEQLKNRR